MTSVDSGVETGNDSNDSYVTIDSQSASLEISPIKNVSNLTYSLTPQTTMNSSAMNNPSSSSIQDESSVDKDQIDETKSMSSLSFRLPPQRPLLDVEPPAGISFRHIQPSSFGLGNGAYEVIGGHGYALAVYQNVELQRKLRAVRCRLKNTRDTWLQFKGPLDERKLRYAASTNNVDHVSALLSSGVNPNSCDDQQRSPLHLAACRGYCDVVRLLLEKGANPNQRDSLGNTPLHLAACTNNVGVITLLLKAGTDVSSSDYYGRSPLQLAQSKLKLLQRGSSDDDSKQFKKEVQQVIEMMLTYLHKRGQDTEAELLSAFSSRLTLSQTKEEVETDVRDLLASLDNLSLNRSEPDSCSNVKNLF